MLQYLEAVRNIVVERAERGGKVSAEEAEALQGARILYGVGYRKRSFGTCFHAGWNERDAAIEIAARNQESPWQLAVTMTHELGHVLVKGHRAPWRDACVRLGFTERPKAKHGHEVGILVTDLGASIQAEIERLNSEKPTLAFGGGLRKQTTRMRKYACPCGQIVRAATDTLRAVHVECGGEFELQAGGKEIA